MKRVNFSWSQLLILGGSTIASWLAGTTKLPPVQTGNGAPSSVTVPRDIPAPVRLQDWRGSAVVVARPERNVFTFKAKEPVRAAARPSEQPQPVAPATPAEPPAFRLIGMAQDDGHDAPAATAIVAGHGQVFLVRPGDVIPPAYTIVRVDAESVELVDGTTGATFRLFMK
jgi:hypothetical protein